MDMFRAQQRLDEFRRGLGSYATHLDRTTELDDLLDAAERNGWTAERIGQYIAGRLPREAKSGLVVITLRTVARRPEPATPNDHQLRALARADRFRQPLPPCGSCDGSPARWLAVPVPAGWTSLRCVIHCPTCWTPPPGYVTPAARRGGQLD